MKNNTISNINDNNSNKNIFPNKIYILFFILLTFVSGLIEIYSLKIDNMFTFMETGNLINVVVNLLPYSFNFIYPLYSLILFIIFIFILVIIKNKIVKKKKNYVTYSLLILLILSFILIFIPNNITDTSNRLNICKFIRITLNTLFGVILIFTFISFKSINYVPTMMTNNIKMATTNLSLYLVNKNKSNLNTFLYYLIIIISFIVGIVIGLILIVFKDNIFRLVIFKNYEFNQNIIYVLSFILLIILNLIYRYKLKKYLNNEGNIVENK